MNQIVVFLPPAVENHKKRYSQLKRIVEGHLNRIVGDISLLNKQTNVKLVFQDEFETSFDWKEKAYVIYAGISSKVDRKYATHVYDLLEDGATFLPIFLTDTPNNDAPEIIHKFQGIKFNKNLRRTCITALNNALNHFCLNGQWKIFISYSQKEGREMALQLYEKLKSMHYEPFLDTHSLNYSCNFQMKLKQFLKDCDVMLLLDSGENRNSKWCETEVIEAQRAGVGVLALQWQHLASLPIYAFCKTIVIPSNTTILDNRTLSVVLRQLEIIKTKSYAQKQETLLAKVNRRKRIPYSIVSNEVGYCYEASAGAPIIYPVTGIPTSVHFEIASSLRSGTRNVEIAYQKCNLDTTIIEHIKWLSDKTGIESQGY